MATITQTVEEFLPVTLTKQLTPPKTKMNLPSKKQELPPQTLGCPPDCSCKKTSPYKPMNLFFNAIGIIVALIATYMIVTSNSNLYLVFWVCYSVLRRLAKPRVHAKKD
ncbi:uncharacterized protein LOC142980735 [Anticarsia gemmatalis]|uniref:uncharacterized protein LOC142980735 n=1 Tax=Anticarsia gemmatalis TaxID=129554 RepID=UPI003F760C0A